MASNECRHFENCSSPLCPMDEESLLHCYWFGDEPICKLQSENHNWVKRQKKIARAVQDNSTYFTLPMLQHPCVIGSALTGIDPDAIDFEREKQEGLWFRKHPKKRELSTEEKAKVRERFELATLKKEAIRKANVA